MNKYYYDFHIHSCLSPCADDDNTPNNIAGMGHLSRLNIMALTDHNTCKNCPAFFEAAKRYGIIPIAGMELTTAEDIHIVCLFENLSDAQEFEKEIDKHRIIVKNRVEVYGEQMVMDGEDNIIEIEENLLSVATKITVEQCPDLVEKYNGICYPAHIDRMANGIIATLGTFPEINGFNCVEFHDKNKISEYKQNYNIESKIIILGSDAHTLGDIKDKENYFEIDDEPYSSKTVRHRLFDILRGGL